MLNKLNKKSQSQIITTVLLILLVLAAIVIVWQVVQGTVKKGGKEVERQSECIGLNIDIVKVVLGEDESSVVIKPNKQIQGYKVYVKGSQYNTGDGKIVNELESEIVTPATSTTKISSGDKVEVAGKLNGVWCPITSSTIA